MRGRRQDRVMRWLICAKIEPGHAKPYAPLPGDAGNTITYRFHNNGNLVRAGLNYRF